VLCVRVTRPNSWNLVLGCIRDTWRARGWGSRPTLKCYTVLTNHSHASDLQTRIHNKKLQHAHPSYVVSYPQLPVAQQTGDTPRCLYPVECNLRHARLCLRVQEGNQQDHQHSRHEATTIQNWWSRMGDNLAVVWSVKSELISSYPYCDLAD